ANVARHAECVRVVLLTSRQLTVVPDAVAHLLQRVVLRTNAHELGEALEPTLHVVMRRDLRGRFFPTNKCSHPVNAGIKRNDDAPRSKVAGRFACFFRTHKKATSNVEMQLDGGLMRAGHSPRT